MPLIHKRPIVKKRELPASLLSWFEGSKVADSNGNPLMVFHGTDKPGYSKFDTDPKIGKNQLSYLGTWFVNDPKVASEFAKEMQYGEFPTGEEGGIYPVYLKITNPKYYIPGDTSVKADAISKLEDERKKLHARSKGLISKQRFTDYNETEHTKRKLEIADIDEKLLAIKMRLRMIRDDDPLEQLMDDRDEFATWMAGRKPIRGAWRDRYIEMGDLRATSRELKKKLMSEGYDGIILKSTEYDAEPAGSISDQYVVFKPNQIKSALGNKGTYKKDSDDITESIGEKSISSITPEEYDDGYHQYETKKIVAEQFGSTIVEASKPDHIILVPSSGKEPWQMTRDEFYKHKVLYHGTSGDATPEGFSKFKTKRGSYTLTPQIRYAWEYPGSTKSADRKVVAVLADISNVFDTEKGSFNGKDYDKHITDLKSKGHDAKSTFGGSEIGVFDDNKVSSFAIMPARKLPPNDWHEYLVKRAVAEGKPVPENVLKDYIEDVSDKKIESFHGRKIPVSSEVTKPSTELKFSVSLDEDDDGVIAVTLDGLGVFKGVYGDALVAPDKDELRSLLKNDNASEGAIDAVLNSRIKYQVAYVTDLTVPENMRRRGYGLVLLKELVKRSRAKSVILVAATTDDILNGFYNKIGFKNMGQAEMGPVLFLSDVTKIGSHVFKPTHEASTAKETIKEPRKSYQGDVNKKSDIWVFHGEHPTERHGGASSGIYVTTDIAKAADFAGPRGDRGVIHAYLVDRSSLSHSPEGSKRKTNLDDEAIINSKDILRSEIVPANVVNKFDDDIIQWAKKKLGSSRPTHQVAETWMEILGV